MMTREEVAQRMGCLLSRAAKSAGLSVGELSTRSGFAERSLRRTMAGTHMMRLDSLNTALEHCGFELTVSMKPIEDDDDDE